MNGDIERTLRDSLDRHAAGAATPAGDIHAVFHRYDARRRRRRSFAAAGSLVAVAAGVVGFAAVRAGDPAAGSPDDTLGLAQTDTTYVLRDGALVWACVGHLGNDGGHDLYADCHQIDAATVGPCEVPTSTMPLTVPTVVEDTAPATAPPSVPETSVLSLAPPSVPDADPCATGPAYLDSACFAPTTPPPVPTTIEVPVATSPSSDPISSWPACDEVPIATAPPTTAPPDGPIVTQHLGALDCRIDQAIHPTTTAIIAGQVSETEQIYTVVAGDTLIDLAHRHGVDPATLANYNEWPDCLDHPLFPGDQIKIPPGAIVPTP